MLDFSNIALARCVDLGWWITDRKAGCVAVQRKRRAAFEADRADPAGGSFESLFAVTRLQGLQQRFDSGIRGIDATCLRRRLDLSAFFTIENASTWAHVSFTGFARRKPVWAAR